MDKMQEDDVKIHLVCKNVFYRLALSFYLKGHLSVVDKADFIICDNKDLLQRDDNKPICFIGEDLIMPCSVYSIFYQLHDFYERASKSIIKAQRVEPEVKNADLLSYFKQNENLNNLLQKDPNLSNELISMLEEFKNNYLNKGV